MREVTLQIRHHGEPESDISADYPAITIRSVSSMTGSAAERKRIIEITGPEASIAGFLEEFEAADPVIDVDTLTPLDVPRVLVAVTIDSYQWDSIAQRLTDLGVHYRTGAVISAGWERWTLYLAEDDDLNEIVESIERPGNETDLVRNVELGVVAEQEQLEFSRVINELTQRQREVLGTAIELGYYRPKKETSIEDIADAVGIASTTAWEHLARAETKVMEEVGKHVNSNAFDANDSK
ncbi:MULTISPECIES: helix-turn-helix domain-containing protein [unclassified Haladaptatus]|uniref:helix-turn-helix domain-containing protein n=1 Tax=unclassified Haladaptatus TaxID=2622732 RepID=UPI00209C34F6|nr:MULTISPECIES: helix-turn-helix domain-containing protein [unclassified Haladaptatus]MCO8246405.1 helix-turn-helix domain-containing protein [Haladaptatus sp. AB643]MCO8255307.1 helix-turn-helix domain-containing protein [Haladaptatus sp. AB618]